MAVTRTPKTPESPLKGEEVAGWAAMELRAAGWTPIRQHQADAGQAGVALPTFVAWKPGHPPLAIWCKSDDSAEKAAGDNGLTDGQQPWADLLDAAGATVLVITPSTREQATSTIKGAS